MKVLIATHHYYDLTGSETFAYTLARALVFQGCNVAIYSPYVGGVITEKTMQLGIPVISNLQTLKDERFDVIHLSHNLVALEVRYCFPHTPIIFLSHGVLPFLEQPPLEDLNISTFLAVSEEVRDNLIQSGIPNDNVFIFRNMVDTQRFCPDERIETKPRRVLVNSRRMDQQTKSIVAEACERLGLEMKFLGNPENIEWDVERYINQVDICVSLGRGILEAMSCGRAAIVFDYNGGDGIVTRDNIDEIQKCNFSGRRFKKRYGVEALIDEIQKYTPQMGIANRAMIEERFSAEKNGNAVIDIYEKAINSFEHKPLRLDRLNYLENLITETRNYSFETVRRRFDGIVRDKESALIDLQRAIRDDNQKIAQLQVLLSEKDREMGNLKEAISQKAIEISYLESMAGEKDGEIGSLKEAINQKTTRISYLESMAGEKDGEIGSLKEAINQKTTQISYLERMVREKNSGIGNLKEVIDQKATQISYLQGRIDEKETILNHIYYSHGWKVLLAYYRLRDTVLPVNSRRRKAAKFVWAFLKKFRFRTLRLSGTGKIRKSILYLKNYGVVMFAKKVWSKLTSEKVTLSHKPNVPNLSLPAINEPGKEIISYDDATVSVVIPTKNAGSDFELLLSMLKRQKGLKEIEIVVVDSGSSDKTVETAKAYGARVIEIPPENFSHSYSRNTGVENASGKYLFFTVQDALPPSELFLYEILTVLKNNDVAAVSCAEFPKEDVDLFYSVLLWNHYKFLEVDKNDRILSLPETETHMNLRKNGQLSNLDCLISKHIFMKYKYRRDYAEDLDLGIRLIKDGYKLAFLSSIKIIHSHNRPAYYFLRRAYVDALFLTSIFPDYPTPAIKEEQLLRDISRTYPSITSLVNEDLSHIKTPIGIGELFDVIGKHLSSFDSHKYTASSNDVDCSHMDKDFRSFLKEVSGIYHIPEGSNSSEGILNHAVLNFMNIVKEYMASSYQIVDDDVLEDFKSLLIKTYALQCGAYLAYCYLNQGSVVRGLHKRLKGEI